MICPRCDAPAAVGILCAACATALAPCDGLLREHVVSPPARAGTAAWLVDGFGAAHAVPDAGAKIGRRPESDLTIVHGSVSRDHAELSRAPGGWRLRDLGSRNGTRVDGRRVPGRAELPATALLVVGEVRLWFVARALPLPAGDRGLATTLPTTEDTARFTLRRDDLELCVLGGGGDARTGAVLYRRRAADGWAELALSPLELKLLRVLCEQALADIDSPSPSRGCIATRQLARELPFQSPYADEENVRQIVRRLRTALAGAGAHGVVEGVQGRGYFLAWTLAIA
ncbi:MAG TPA: FHA domain-containing protein [Kofleriaceae bacterium]|nr:FHA domain-containing protein [Kofleriaceae bacterium]